MKKYNYAYTVWIYFCKNEYNRFVKGLPHLQREQGAILFRYLKGNAGTDYGKKYRFSQINNYEDFVANVPLINNWQQLEEELNQLQAGKKKVLTAEPVLVFEETSGSTGFSKLIPYTRSLKAEFGAALDVWMYMLWTQYPAAFKGKSFWAISPALKAKRQTPSGIKIGMDSDLEYLNPIGAMVMNSVLAVRQEKLPTGDKDAFFTGCLVQLLLNESLSFISIWSPNYFLVLDAFLRSNFVVILKEVAMHSAKRAEALCLLDKQQFTWKEIWPHLALISCWTEAQAAMWLGAVHQKSGGILVQGKGLMSTEAVCSIPFGEAGKTLLAYRSHFFEFRELDATRILSAPDLDLNILLKGKNVLSAPEFGKDELDKVAKILRAHELEIGGLYEVILSTGSGLMRYASGDMVEVTGKEKSVPYLSFKGRVGANCDLVGEKLHENHLMAALLEVWSKEMYGIEGVFFYPEKSTDGVHYVLALEMEKLPHLLAQKLVQTEAVLCKNPYYLQAIKSGQLQALTCKIVAAGSSKKIKQHIQSARSIKEGDFKMPLLLKDPNLIDLLNEQK